MGGSPWEGGCLGRWSEVHTLVSVSRGQGLAEKLLPKRRIAVLSRALASYTGALGFRRICPDKRAGAARPQEGGCLGLRSEVHGREPLGGAPPGKVVARAAGPKSTLRQRMDIAAGVWNQTLTSDGPGLAGNLLPKRRIEAILIWSGYGRG